MGEGRDLNLDLSITARSGNPITGVGLNDNLTKYTDAQQLWQASPGLPAAGTSEPVAAAPAAVAVACLTSDSPVCLERLVIDCPVSTDGL